MNRVVHFEIPVDNPDRALDFYQKVFGREITKWEGPVEYWLINTGQEGQPGIHGGLTRRQPPVQHTTNTVDVSSVDEITVQITQNGGAVLTPKMAVPGVGWMAYCQDPEGNVFGVMQADENAR